MYSPSQPSSADNLSDEQLALQAHAGDKSARDRLILRHRRLVHTVARQYRSSGVAHEDLIQAGTIGLIVAVDRFDPNRGSSFTNYARALIRGELQHQLRDQGWAVRVPRLMQDLGFAAARESEGLTQRIGRPPTVGEIAAALREEPAAVAEALEARDAYMTVELPLETDSTHAHDGDEPRALATVDRGFEEVEADLTIAAVLRRLPPRLRRVIILHFWGGMTQQMIARDIGVSQMQVSRLLRSALEALEEIIDISPFEANTPAPRRETT